MVVLTLIVRADAMAKRKSATRARPGRRVGIFLYDGMMALDAIGPADVFGLANIMTSQEDPAASQPYDVCLVGPLAHRGLPAIVRWRAYSAAPTGRRCRVTADSSTPSTGKRRGDRPTGALPLSCDIVLLPIRSGAVAG